MKLVVPDWPAPHGVRAFCTTRDGGVSAAPFDSLNLGKSAGDDPAAVAENRRRVTALLPQEPVWLSQVHGREVLDLDQWRPGNGREADAAVTRRAGVPCAVMVADCLPVLFAARDGSAVGAAHAGWRGLAAGVLEATLDALGTREVVAWLGPAIGPSAFEVGEDVVEAFGGGDAFAPIAGTPGKHLADLFALARARLAAAGVMDVHGGGECTVSNPGRFFSYRRDGRTGRMAAVVWIES